MRRNCEEMERSEPLPLYLVTHRGDLAVNANEVIATRRVADHSAGPLVETLVVMTHHQAERLGLMVNVLSVAPAPAGDFHGDHDTTVHVAEDGSWHNPAHHG
jgi:hypothetical protein